MRSPIFFASAAALALWACGGPSEPAPASQDEAVNEPTPQPAQTEEQAAASQEEATTPETNDDQDAEDDVEEDSNAAPPPSGSLDAYVAPPPPGKIFNAVTENLGVIKRCYFDALAKSPGLEGTITIRFTVNKKGKVSKAKAVLNELNRKVEKCVIKSLKKMKMPAPDLGETTVEYPFRFVLSE